MYSNNKITSCIIAVAASLSGCSGPSAVTRPNIVIFLADDMGWGDVNANGNTLISTPVLNKLKSESLTLDRFYVCPLSAPTRAEMLTGRYFLRTGVSSVTRGYENMRTNEVTVAEVLKENGYATGCFGKWHNGRYWPQHPNRQGFDEYAGFPVGHLGYYFNAFYLHNDEEKQSEGYSSNYFTEKAIDFISRNKNNSFLCYIPYNVPHSPFQVPEKYFNKYHSEGLDSTLSSVYGMVENMDENIGLVLKKLEDLSLSENTIIIFFSDNGPNTDRYNGGMKGRKGSVDEGGIRVPFYIKWPGKIKPGMSRQLAQDIDIMPTLLGLCGIKYNPQLPFDGIDLSKHIRGRAAESDRLILSRQGNLPVEACNSSVRNNRYRLVITRRDTLLFDLERDPSQKVNIFKSEIEAGKRLLSELVKLNEELVSAYEPVTTIEAGFVAEKSFTLPVQDAILSGNIKYSSIHPNQSHTQNWISTGDSIYWKLDVKDAGRFRIEMQYGCSEEEIGSRFTLISSDARSEFTIDRPFNSEILPDRDYVKRSESVERTWGWMETGELNLKEGPQTIILKLLKISGTDAGIIKALKFTRL
jgi:arylsulfatase A